MKIAMRHILAGLGFGSVSYLVILMTTSFVNQIEIPLSSGHILAILIMSALIGLLSMIFESDRLPFLMEFVIHLIGTAILVWATGSISGCFHTNINAPEIWLNFLIIYIVIWIVIQFNQEKKVSAINQVLVKRKENKK